MSNTQARTTEAKTTEVNIGGFTWKLTVRTNAGKLLEVMFQPKSGLGVQAEAYRTISCAISTALQFTDLMTVVGMFLDKSEATVAGLTSDPEIPRVSSVADYLARRLALDFLSFSQRFDLGIFTPAEWKYRTETGVWAEQPDNRS